MHKLYVINFMLKRGKRPPYTVVASAAFITFARQ